MDHLTLLPPTKDDSGTTLSTNDPLYDIQEDSYELTPEVLSGDEGEPRIDDLPDSKKLTITGVVFNILNTTIGGSILALPYVIRQLGIITGCIVLILGAALISICSSLLQKSKNLSGHSNYVTIARKCFGSKGGAILSTCLLISNLGSCIVFLSIFGLVAQNSFSFFVPECSPKEAFELAPLYCHRSVLVGLGGLIVLPFTFPKNIGKLRIISFVKMISVTVFAAITIGYCIYCVKKGTYSSDVQLWPSLEKPIDMLACIAEVILAYIFTYNQFSIYKSMRRPSDAGFNKAARISMATITTIFIMIGVSGYLIFGKQTNNILQSFTAQELGPVLFLLLNVSFMVFSITTYPPTFFCPRNVLYMAALKQFPGSKTGQVSSSNQSYHEAMIGSEGDNETGARDKTIYSAVVLCSNAILTMLAIVAPNINDLFGLMGSIAANALVFLFPPAFYLMLSSKKAKKRTLAKFLFGLGVIVGSVGFVCNIIKIFVEAN